MLAKRPLTLGVLGMSIVALAWLVDCSSKSADGGSCSANTDCSSSRCGASGTCEGSDCTCEGDDCRGRSSCEAGWLCTRTNATTFDAIPQCRRQCGGTAGACPTDKHCDNGICVDGAEAFTLSWANIPRSKACHAMVPCDYQLEPPAAAVTSYVWTFGDDAGTVTTTTPSTSFTYGEPGTYDVLVQAHATTGAIAELTTTEVLCSGGIGAGCDPNGAPCCEGSCSSLVPDSGAVTCK